MSKLVRKTLVKVVCDTYTCKNLAEFEVGMEAQRALCSHYCRKCMEDIVDGAKEMFGKSEKVSDVPENDTTEYGIKENEKVDNVEETTDEPAEYYTCKYCGKKFVKPDGLTEYRSHSMKCMRENQA